MRKIQNYLLVLLSGILLLVGGCQEELSEPDQDATSLNDPTMLSLSQLTERDLQLITLAKSLAKSLEDVSMRRYIKQEALVDIDGENNMLYELAKSENVGAYSFSSHLVANMPSQDTPKNARQNAKAFFLEQFEEMPLLSIGVPVHLDEWNADEFVPLVAVELSDYDDQNSQYIRAYDIEGKLHLLTLEEAPDAPTIVIRMNERIESLGKKAGKLMYQASDFVPQTKEFAKAMRKFDNHILSRINYDKVNNAINARLCAEGEQPPGCDENPPGGGNPPPPPSSPPCRSRNCNAGNERIYAIKFNSTTAFKQFEKWADRNLELYALVFVNNIPLMPFRQNFYLHYNHFQSCPLVGSCDAVEYRANRDLQFNWNFNTHGQYIGFRWMEKDDGTTRSTAYSYSPCDDCPTITTTYSNTDTDDFIGDRLVEYGSAFYSVQSLDHMYFKLN